MINPFKTKFGSQILSDTTPQEGGSSYWRALFYYNLYRMLLAVFLVTASLTSLSFGSLGSRLPEQFFFTSLTYACLSLLFAFFINKGWPRYITQCRIQILVDIVVIIILYHSSTGRGAGLEILLFITVSATGILLGGRASLITASLASILLILEHFYVIASNQRSLGGFTTLGFIGVGLFITAFIIYYLSLRLRKTEIEIAQQNQRLEKLTHINQLIVEHLHSGVIVVDQLSMVILINKSSIELLGIPESLQLPVPLGNLLSDINIDLITLRKITDEKESKIDLPSGKKLLARYQPLGNTYKNEYIILFDDYSQIEEEKRNEKFIAMGRLSASIAHEIRNPLGAISHAGQLLAESPLVNKDDARLVAIIEHQSKRIDQIIKTILELGQRNGQNFEKIPVHSWLKKIIKTFIRDNGLSGSSILLNANESIDVASISACGDPDQLQQVILNLLSNSLHYANTSTVPFIMINIDENPPDGTTTISISDNGPGIKNDIQDKIFEPFFTTSSTGNGLGLYIARKICLSNDGYLDYINNNDDNGCFMLTLANNRSCQKISGNH
ncbi:PAS domain-containing sensor histidine kinase [Pseudomonadota bacterium]